MGAEAVSEQLERGLALIRAGEYFAAHEELELAWRAAAREERDFFQGLVHVTVAWYQAGRGNRVGCERQLEKAVRRLSPFAPEHRGVDVAAVLAEVGRARGLATDGTLSLPPVELAPPRAPLAAIEGERDLRHGREKGHATLTNP